MLVEREEDGMSGTEVPEKGQIWIRSGDKGLEASVAIHAVERETVRFYPLGGGMSRSASLQTFAEQYEFVSPETAAQWSQENRPILITGDWFDYDAHPIPAYTNGSHWNGFETPAFTREAIEASIRDGGICSDEAGTALLYDANRDTFVLLATADGDPMPKVLDRGALLSRAAAGERVVSMSGADLEITEFPGRAILVDGKALTVYDIGAGSWCWQDFDEPDETPSPRRCR